MKKNNRNKKKFSKGYLINEQINYPEVRITGDDIESKVVRIQEAQDLATELDVDVILITENAKPPVVKIEDFNKFLYKEKRRKEEADKHQREHSRDLKEMRLTPVISGGDLETKTRKITEFLVKGHKVKVTMMFKGRMIQHKEIGERVMLELATELKEHGTPEALPKFNGKFLNMIVSPKK